MHGVAIYKDTMSQNSLSTAEDDEEGYVPGFEEPIKEAEDVGEGGSSDDDEEEVEPMDNSAHESDGVRIAMEEVNEEQGGVAKGNGMGSSLWQDPLGWGWGRHDGGAVDSRKHGVVANGVTRLSPPDVTHNVQEGKALAPAKEKALPKSITSKAPVRRCVFTSDIGSTLDKEKPPLTLGKAWMGLDSSPSTMGARSKERRTDVLAEAQVSRCFCCCTRVSACGVRPL